MRYVDEQYYCEEFQGEPVISAGFPALCAMAEKIVEVAADSGVPVYDNGNQASSASLGKFSYSGISAGNGSTERSVFSPRAERILWPTGLTFRGGGCL